MRDPNIEKIKEANFEQLKRGDIKTTVLQIKDYLENVVSDRLKVQNELKEEIELLKKEYDLT